MVCYRLFSWFIALLDIFVALLHLHLVHKFSNQCRRVFLLAHQQHIIFFLTSSLIKYVFYNWLINNILYLRVT